MNFSYDGFGRGFDVMERLFPILFVLVLGVVVAVMIRGLVQWNRNNHSPELTVYARVVAKRENVSHHDQAHAGDITGAHGTSSMRSTRSCATFAVDSGDRMEFCLSGEAYGQLAEGDDGYLTFKGTRFLDFARK